MFCHNLLMSFLSCLTFFGKTQKVLKNILITFLIYCNENESGLGLLRFKKECVLHLRTRSVWFVNKSFRFIGFVIHLKIQLNRMTHKSLFLSLKCNGELGLMMQFLVSNLNFGLFLIQIYQMVSKISIVARKSNRPHIWCLFCHFKA